MSPVRANTVRLSGSVPGALRSLIFAAFAMTLILTPNAAFAQDGGVRSPFSAGGGLRGIAMGGAQAAIVRDAEALDWNPAGLALVPRTGFLLSRTSYFGEEITESQAVGVVPSWRWGGLALGIRHLGVSGVEERDGRNQVIGSDLGASTMQVALGFGRQFGAWSVGSAVDLNREQVAGSGATGLGLDLGIQVRPYDALTFAPEWLEGVSFGAAWTNLVEPSLRLDQDTVVDPAAFRFGCGYERLGVLGGLLTAALDIETSRVTDTRVFTGLELRIHPALALRSGIGRHGAAMGAGFQYREFDIDYVLEETDLGSVHRVGFAYSFGATTEERREAFVTHQEEALQERLQQASAQREQERIDELLRQTRDLRAAARIEDALATIDVARTLAPDRADAIELEADCWMDRGRELESHDDFTEAALAYARVLTLVPDHASALEAQSRVQAESDRIAKRTEKLRERFATSMDAFGRGDLLTARSGFASLVKENKKDAEAKDMLRRTEEAIARKAGEHVNQARRLLARNLLEEAADEIARAKELSPELDGLAAAESDLARRRSDRVLRDAGVTSSTTLGIDSVASANSNDGTPAAGSSSGSVGAEPSGRAGVSSRSGAGAGASGAKLDPAELSDLYRRGIEASQASRSEDAIRYFELVFSASPGYALVRDNLVREYLTLGMDRFAAGELDGAISIWQRALQVDPDDEKARGYLERALRHKNRSQEILGSNR
ncbi:MAG: hypothetical protein H6682_12410 [Candidatus Eisenbacteria bacterium]|nr:hypothetical protein [Candidatus Eisenbacteria bacterium]